METKDIEDSPFEVLVQCSKVTTPDIYCPSGRKVVKICSNPNCEVAFQCSSFQCDHCGKKVHETCQSYSLDLITSLLNDQIMQQTQLFEYVEQLDKRVIETLTENKKELISHRSFNSFPENMQNIVQKIYQNQTFNTVSGAQGQELYEKILQIKSSSKSRIPKALEKYKKTLNKTIQELIALKKKLFSGVLYEYEMDSVILNNRDEKTKELYSYLIEELNHPKELILLYRGSENNFRAPAFHEKCGDKENTLTIVRTGYGKTIAAFTPYKWHSVPDWQYVGNPKGGCFILSLDNKQKLIPHETTRLIHNCFEWGPVFGGINGDDLAISDQCNIRDKSWFGIFSTYNTVDLKYKKSQQTFKHLSGAISSMHFKVLEYEVFQVVR